MDTLMEVDRDVASATASSAGISGIWEGWLDEGDLQRLAAHPLLDALRSGSVGLGTLKRLLAQHSQYSSHFTRYLCALIGQLNDVENILALLANLREEMGVDGHGEMTHAEMYQRTLRVVGVVPGDHAPLPETLALRQAMMGRCQASDPLEGLAAMCLGAEAIVPVIYRPILTALQQSGFGENATEFFRLHIEEDEDHALTMLAIMRDLIGDDKARFDFAVGIGREMIARRIDMFDAVWRDSQRAEAAPADNDAGGFTSADFGRVPSRLTARLPERLVHENVIRAGADDEFSSARKHKVHIVDLPSRTLSMTIGHLDDGQSTRLHRHNYETVIYVMQGGGYSRVGDRRVDWKAGDAFYVPVWAEHQHVNTSSDECIYLACENAPLLQNLGGIALREEIGTAGA
jgi:pyrroloquinoline quinone (PQQ) biosynthesis protein C/quercetin dioxygenase-like cupin family protein